MFGPCGLTAAGSVIGRGGALAAARLLADLLYPIRIAE